jgi:small subunit ribosomal protein S1
MKTSKFEVKWDVDDGSFDAEFADSRKGLGGDDDFLAMLNSSDIKERASFQVGDAVRGTISAISDHSDDVTVEIGAKASAVIAKQDLYAGHEGKVFRQGDEIEAFVVSRSGGEIILARSLSQRAMGDQALEEAQANGMPVKGKVIKVNKGGFEVQVVGKSGFCPVSQMDLRFIKDEDKDRYIGKEFDFLVEQVSGRNIVLSRSALLKRGQAETIEKVKAAIKDQATYDGTVVELRDFGAIIEFLGLSGMAHISELSHSRVAHVSEVLAPGQDVRVKVLAVDEQKGQPRISLSIKQAMDDPWVEEAGKIAVGESYPAKVTRLEAFGAFAEIRPGIEGLIHVSELSWTKRVHHPREVLNAGDRITARVLSVDSATRRISLSLKSLFDDPWVKVERDLKVGAPAKGKVASLKAFGAIVDLEQGVQGLLPAGVLRHVFGDGFRKHVIPPKEIDVLIGRIDRDTRKILLSLPNVNADDENESEFRDYLQAEAVARESRGREERSVGSFGELLSKTLHSSK